MKPYVTSRFELNSRTKGLLKELTPKFGYNGFGEMVFYRTYSRVNCKNCGRLVKYDELDQPYCPSCNDRFEPGQEDWADCVIRGTEGTFSIRKDWYLRTGVNWEENFWQDYAERFALSMFHMYWMPPGRGLWAMGSDFVYERGSMALYNCAYTDLGEDWSDDLGWVMDCLMHGVGVGFGPIRDDGMRLYTPHGSYDCVIPDSREGWVDSCLKLMDAYRLPHQKRPRFVYDKIRAKGLPIKGFGGVASGPGPLRHLHEGIIESCENYRSKSEYDSVRLKTDLSNRIGCCVVAGNVRRSAELCCASIRDKTFLDLKNYEKYPDRAEYGWMSNNSAILDSDSDFEMLGEIAERVKVRGEPGYINARNLRFGRIGKRDRVRRDRAKGLNPCGEIPLESRETCNVVETLPTMCPTIEDWYEACEHATFYASTVSLLPTHQPSTNKVVARNRRIGVSIIDVSGWEKISGVHKVTTYMRKGYQVVCQRNREVNAEAGVPEAIRKTTIKPGGTTPKLPGRTSGIGFPTFDYTIRRMRILAGSPFEKVVRDAGYPIEKDAYSMNTNVVEAPIFQGPADPAEKVSLWQQAMRLVWVQREWADNAVSNTLYFRPKWPEISSIDRDFEDALSRYTDLQIISVGLANDLIKEHRDFYEADGYRFQFEYGECPNCKGAQRSAEQFKFPDSSQVSKDEDCTVCDGWGKSLSKIRVRQFDPQHEEDCIAPVLAYIAPLTKSISLLPHSYKGAYTQMPEEGITKEEYYRRLGELQPINWSEFGGSDGIDERFCDAEKCAAPL